MELTLQAEVRAEKGTGAAHKLRRQGLIPAVVYSKASSECLSLSRHETERLVTHAGTGRLIRLTIKRGKKSEKTPVLIKEVQRNPVRGEITHVDFHAVALDKAIGTHVPVHLFGDEKRLHDGAIIEQFAREIEVSCLPAEIPDRFRVDVSGLVIGASIHVKDLVPPVGVKIVTPGEELIVAAAAPAVVEEAAPAVPAEAIEETEAAAEKEKKEEDK